MVTSKVSYAIVTLGRAMVRMMFGTSRTSWITTPWKGGKPDLLACVPKARSYLLKRHTTVIAHSATLAGALSLVALGLTARPGNADRSQAQARSGDSVQMAGASSLDMQPLRMGSKAWTTQVRPAVGDNPLEVKVLPHIIQTAGPNPGPVPLQALPSSSSVPPALPTWDGVGTSGTQSPAPQAQIGLATFSRILAERALGIKSAHPDSPPRARGASRVPFASMALARTKGISSTGPKGTSAGLATAQTQRTTRLSSLGLERVLDHQTIATGSLAPVAPAAGSALGLGLTLQRRPDASGLKLLGVRPGATQYLRWGEKPAPLGRPKPDRTPTFTRASFKQPAPTPVTGGTKSWTSANMPGGNARTFYITGYTATGSRTATGTWPHWGTVAVDRQTIPLGSTVYIQGLGIFHAEDTGGGVIGNHVDVFVNSAAEAYQLTGYRLVSFIPPGQ
jgi:3D (Asp-Asp-Asp) domain-containing protein